MKFTLQQIADTHAKVKSGADFPKYVQDLKALGMTAYIINVSNGKTKYFDNDGATLESEEKYDALDVNPILNEAIFAERLKLHQQGGTDYATFSKDCAKNGVAGWSLDFDAMTCTYFDLENNNFLMETIPGL